ncbi:MAG TPA: hypothetical protein VKE42_09760 [Candidatus Cybelea sp.]|nr:hypothetical protein [Candidatus Cybelea sp.]
MMIFAVAGTALLVTPASAQSSLHSATHSAAKSDTRRADARGVPSYDVAPSCRAMAALPEARLFDSSGADAPDPTQRCVDEENKARQELLECWTKFTPADRALCAGVSRAGRVDPAYTELETCLEMAQDNDGSGTPAQRPRQQGPSADLR